MTLKILNNDAGKWRAPITFTYKDLKITYVSTQQRRILFEPNNENDRAFNLTEMGHTVLRLFR
jgi:gamma-glutamyltranspeptidase/glutathione hydrolase